jgi:PAS domain S-box-containing protein
MRERILRFFGPPATDGSGANVRPALLSRILNIHVAVALFIGLFYRPSPDSRTAAFAALATIPLAIGLRFLLHRGASRLASWIFLIGLALTLWMLFVFVAGAGGVTAICVSQMMLIVIAGLLLGGREAIGFAAFMVASNGFFLWSEALRVPAQGYALTAVWTLQAAFFLGTAVLMARAVWLIEQASERASREAAERQVVEAALRENMERYRLITTVSSDYAFSTEVAEGGSLRLNWVAGAFEAITGFAFDEYVARGGWRAALHPDDVAQDARGLEALRGNHPVASELRTLCKDGSVRWVRVYAHPVWDEAEGGLKGIYGAVQDINARKAAEAEREALIGELEARNAELERFTYTVSHDLKSPLITIRGFLTHIEQAAAEGRIEAVRSDMDRVYKSADRMHRLLDDLLELSRIGRLAKPPEDVAFESVVKDALDRTHGQLTSQRVAVEVESGLPAVRGDRDRLAEVMQNLIDNAAKFMGDQPAPRIRIGVRGGPAERTFFVEDNGTGIEPQHRERVFNLFDKLDPKSAGTGVGLALVKRIIEVHGGRIWVESPGRGKGATFLFTLSQTPATSPPEPATGVSS